MRLGLAYLLSLFVLSFSVHADWPMADSGLFTVDTWSSVKDSDSVPDDWELAHKLDIASNDAEFDPDGNARSNLNEYNIGTNPNVDDWAGGGIGDSGLFTVNTQSARIDIDNDGLSDSWEVEHGLKTNADDSAADPDGDGLSNLTEYNYGTNPGVDDWAGPTSASSVLFAVDTGGFSGGYELDQDGVGIPDWWEVQYVLNPKLKAALIDSDGDGLRSYDE